MRKIPTLFRRDPDDLRHVLPEVHPECKWVLDGEGIATRKYDGTCVLLDENGAWWARREVKPGKPFPPLFLPVETDNATGKTVGWEPITQSPFAKFHTQALRWVDGDPEYAEPPTYEPGTYELCGPKVNGNPEGLPAHRLIRHGATQVADGTGFRTYEEVRQAALGLGAQGMEGMVWHHPDGRMAKIKARDFR